jgi:L-ribulose-5-phosphate 4-epimerase
MKNSDGRFREIKELVFEANMRLYQSGLVPLTFGNVSEKFAFEDNYLVAIKPSGVAYDRLQPEDIVILRPDGNALTGALRPSSDTPTHLIIYARLPHWAGITHTHSSFATAWAQAGRSIPILGTTHADYLPCPVPCTPPMTDADIGITYEHNTGIRLVEHLLTSGAALSPMVLVHGHGPFTFGSSSSASVEASIALEEIARMAYYSLAINPLATTITPALIDRHYFRKHGAHKYYGQN